MQTLELTEKNLRKKVDPEGDIVLTDLNYESYMQVHPAAVVVYTSPSGKVKTLKNRYGSIGEGRHESREIAGTD